MVRGSSEFRSPAFRTSGSPAVPPAAAVGCGVLWRRVPSGVYSLRKTGVALLVDADVPVPTRTTRTLPDAAAAAWAGAASAAAGEQAQSV